MDTPTEPTTNPTPPCAVCDDPIILGAEPAHQFHDTDCNVVTATFFDPTDDTAIGAALESCTCPPEAVVHPDCCQVCAGVDTVFAP